MNPTTPQEYASAVSLLVLGGVITHFFSLLQPKSKLVFWHPHSFLFDRVQGNTLIHTQTYTIQNLGRKSCEAIEIIHRQRPDYFQLQPERQFCEVTVPNHEHVIRIAKEFFSVERLSYAQLPNLLGVRSKDGQAQEIEFFMQRVQPKWKIRLTIGFIVIGLISTIYTAIKFGSYAYQLMLS